MIVENKTFWENEKVIATQDVEVSSSYDYEIYLYQKAKSYIQKNAQPYTAKIFGCGTGREIPEVIKYLGISSVIASDISENMIKKCILNLKRWKLKDKVKTINVNASKFESKNETFDVITLMNNILTYVIDKQERYTIIKNAYLYLKPNGCIIGVVHHQVGTPKKTIYFKLRSLFKPFLKSEIGYRLTGFKGLKFGGHYFKKEELYRHLEDNGFKNIHILSLKELYKKTNRKYHLWKSYNNLVFFATK